MPAPKSVEWVDSAEELLAEILWRISCDNPIAADELNDDILSALSMAAACPTLYRASARMEGVREIVVRPNFVVAYRITTTSIEVLDVVHARRDWPHPPLAPR